MPSEVVTTLKGDGAAPWIVIHSETPQENEKLLTEVMEGLTQTAGEANSLFTASTRIANSLGQNAPQDQPPAQQNQGYNNQGRQQVQQNQGGQQWNRPPANTSSFNGTPHPQGLVCQLCGAGVVGKQPREKKMWTCPNQKTKGDGHYMEWLNG